MTSNQITKKLQKVGIDTSELKIERDEVTACVGYYETNNNGHIFGGCDERKTRELANKVLKALDWKSYYTNGYGAFVLTSYKLNIDYGNCL